MTYRLRDEQVRSDHRLFQPMLDLQTLTSALHVAFEIMVKGGSEIETWKPGDWMQTISTPFPDRAVKLSSRMPMFLLARGESVEALQITMSETYQQPNPVAYPKAVADPFDDAMWRIAVTTYIAFYERWIPEFQSRFSDDIARWPAGVFPFAKRVRDFLAHTDGVVRFKSKAPKPVSWYGVSYAKSDEGKKVHDDLGVADIIALMFEMDDEMTARGFPGA